MDRTAVRTALTLVVAGTASLALPMATASAAPTGKDAIGVVVAKGGLVGHELPSRHAPDRVTFANGSKLVLDCKVPGPVVDGNALWYYAFGDDDDGWVSARYVKNVGPAPDPCDPSDGSFSAKATTALKKRVGPSTADASAGTYAKGAKFRVRCYTGYEQKWYLTDGSRWVRAAYVTTSSKVRYCSNL